MKFPKPEKRKKKKRRFLRKVSDKRRAQLKSYLQSGRELKSKHKAQFCEAGSVMIGPLPVCVISGCGEKPCRANERHHLEGRRNEKLNDPENMIAVGRACHDWIEKNRADAYAVGLLRHRNRS